MYSDKLIKLWLFISVVLVSCQPSLDEPNYTSGQADFSRYVAVGNSFTAGYMDGGLHRRGQEQSIPALISSRLSLAGGGEFRQPLLPEGNGISFMPFGGFSGVLKLENKINCAGQPDIGSVRLTGNQSDLAWIGNQGPFNNMGVPEAKSFNLYSQYFGKGGATGSPYYFRFASDTGGASGLSSTVLGDAMKINPTFFTLWIGTNDVFMYAVYGGTGSASGVQLLDITPEDTFNFAVDKIVNAMTGNGAKGVLANIPDIADVPYFSSIPYNGLILNAQQAAALNAVSPPGITFQAGANPFVVYNPGGSTIRQAVEGDRLLLSIPQDSLRCGAWGTPQKPIPATYVLDATESENVRAATLKFNAKIRAKATEKNLAFVDAYNFFKTVDAGFVFNGVTLNADYLSGGFYSIDGIYPNGKGYALIANEFIRAINSRYKSNLPEVDVNASTGILFP